MVNILLTLAAEKFKECRIIAWIMIRTISLLCLLVVIPLTAAWAAASVPVRVQVVDAKGVPVLVDGSQGAVHLPVDVADIGCDFYVITGHKLYGPSGSGANFIKSERMAEMRPFLGGGDMIREVSKDQVIYAAPPMKFEAGTPGIVQTIGLGVALD